MTSTKFDNNKNAPSSPAPCRQREGVSTGMFSTATAVSSIRGTERARKTKTKDKNRERRERGIIEQQHEGVPTALSRLVFSLVERDKRERGTPERRGSSSNRKVAALHLNRYMLIYQLLLTASPLMRERKHRRATVAFAKSAKGGE